MGKQTDTASEAGWGTVKILIYPVGIEIMPNLQTQAEISSKTASNQPAQAPVATTPKPQALAAREN
jgi:hypothetical protein